MKFRDCHERSMRHWSFKLTILSREKCPCGENRVPLRLAGTDLRLHLAANTSIRNSNTSRLGHKSFCQDVGSRQRANYPSGSSTFVGSGYIHRPVVNQHHSYWILLPITIVMILTGVLRHYATILLATPPKPASTTLEARERQSIMRGISLRNNASAALSTSSFLSRKEYFVDSYKKGAFLKGGPQSRGQQAPNPMTDPAAMEGMMGM